MKPQTHTRIGDMLFAILLATSMAMGAYILTDKHTCGEE